MCCGRRLCAACGAVLAVLAAVLGCWVHRLRAPRHYPDRLITRRELEVQPRPSGGEYAWPIKMGDLPRSGRASVAAPLDLAAGPVWSFYAGSVVYSTTLIDAQGDVYVATTAGMIYRLKRSGEVVWKYKLKGVMPPCPALFDGALFVSDTLGWGYSLDMASGQERWVRRIHKFLGEDNWAVFAGAGLVTFSVSNVRGVPVSTDDEAQLVAVSATDGTELWRATAASSFFNVMPALADGGRSLLFTDASMGFYKVEADSGRELWRQPGYTNWTSIGGPRSLAGCTLVDARRGTVYVSGNPSQLTGIVRAHRLTGELLWSTPLKYQMANAAALADINGVPTLVLGTGYPMPMHLSLPEAKNPYEGLLYALHAETGEVLWTFAPTPAQASPLCVGNHLLTLDPVFNLPDAFSAPAIDSNGTVFVGWHGGIVYALDGRTGREISHYDAEEGIQGAPSFGPDGELVIATGTHVQSFWH